MVEPISITALVLACISAVGVIIKSISDAVSKSSCYSSTVVSSSGSIRKTRRFSGNNDDIHSDNRNENDESE